MINSTDESLVKESFEHNVLRIPGTFGARVSQGGSVATISGDDDQTIAQIISDGGGLTELRFEPTSDRTQVSFRVESDRGSASSEVLGTISFSENSDRPSTGLIDLETGHLVEGELTLRISGEAFASPVDVAAPVALGQLVFAPYGFRHYHALVTGELPLDFPQLGGLVYTLDKCDDPKDDVDCDTRLVDPPDPRCSLGGTECSSEGGPCARNGEQRTCQTIVVFNRCRCACQ